MSSSSLEDWYTIEEAVKITGKSESTLGRMVRFKQIERRFRKNPGHKDLAVLDPDKVNAMRDPTLQPALAEESAALTVIPEEREKRKKAVNAVMKVSDDLMVLLKELRTPGLHLKDKLTMTVDEAAELSGFSPYQIRQAARTGELRAIKRGGYKIRFADLCTWVDRLYGEDHTVNALNKAVSNGVNGVSRESTPGPST